MKRNEAMGERDRSSVGRTADPLTATAPDPAVDTSIVDPAFRLRAPVAGTAATNVIVSAVGSVGGLLLARGLGPSLRGEVAIVVTWPAFAAALLVLGLPQATCYVASRRPEESSSVISTGSLLAVAFGAVVALGGVLAAPLVGRRPEVTSALRLLFLLAPLTMVVGVWSGALQARDIHRWNASRLLQPLVYTFFIAVLFRTGRLTVTSVTWALAASLIVQFVGVGGLVRGRGRHRLSGPRRLIARALLGYGLRNTTAGAPWLVNSRLDQLILSVTVSSSALGNYAVAVSVSLLAAPLATAFGSVAFPRIAGARSHEEARRVQRTAIVGSALAAGAVLAALVVLAPALFPVVFGRDFRAAVTPFRILAVGTVPFVVNQVMGDVLRGWGRPLQPALAEGLGTVATIVLLAVLIPLLDINGAALASTIAYAAVTVVLLRMIAGASGREGSVLATADEAAPGFPRHRDT